MTIRNFSTLLAGLLLTVGSLGYESLPEAAAATINYDFLTSDGSWTTVNQGDAIWSRAPGTGWSTAGSTSAATNYLVSPPLTVSATGPVSGSLTHYWDFEAGFDAGTIQYRLVGASGWTYVPLGLTGLNSTQGYNGSWNEGQDAFSSALGSSSNLVTTDFTLGSSSAATFTAGDTIEIAFTGNWDASEAQPSPNWVITSASVSNVNAVPEPSTFALAFAGAGLALGGIAYRRRRSKASA